MGRHLALLHAVAAAPTALLLVAAGAAFYFGGWPAAAALITLAMLEMALAADSAVPMAGLAGRLHRVTRQIFLAVGLTLAVVLMRLAATPVAVAAITGEPTTDAVAHIFLSSGAFSESLDLARPSLAGFGAVFVWLVFGDYLMNVERKERPLWIAPLEAPFFRLRRPRLVQFAVAGAGALWASLVAPAGSGIAVALAGAAGIVAFCGVKWVERHCAPPRTGAVRAIAYATTVIFERALVVFMMFEILDGAYTFTGASEGLPFIGKIAIACAGIGVGAVFLTRLTRELDSVDALARRRFLPAGAAYVLGVLAVLLWISLITPIPAAVTAWFGTVVIVAALLTSHLPRFPREAAPIGE